MEPALREQAEKMGYQVISSEQAHAEGQFLQYLHARGVFTNPKPVFTHIMGMGCSRLHCGECDALLCLLLGNSYHSITAAVSVANITSPFKIIPGEDECHFKLERQETESCVIVSGEQAVELGKKTKATNSEEEAKASKGEAGGGAEKAKKTSKEKSDGGKEEKKEEAGTAEKKIYKKCFLPEELRELIRARLGVGSIKWGKKYTKIKKEKY
jgi:hypothetical protein